MPDHQPYTPPTLTRVVLEPTQAVLSKCSTSTTAITDNVAGVCLPIGGMPGNCSKFNGQVGGDSQALS